MANVPYEQVVESLIYRPTCTRPDNAAAASTLIGFFRVRDCTLGEGVEHSCRPLETLEQACPNVSRKETHCTNCVRLLDRMKKMYFASENVTYFNQYSSEKKNQKKRNHTRVMVIKKNPIILGFSEQICR